MKFAGPFTDKAERGMFFGTDFTGDPGKTEQNHKNETDINLIMNRYKQTGQMPARMAQPIFGDFTDMPDYQQAVTRIREAEEAFLQIPSQVRLRFGNDPGEFIKFATNPENKEELQKLGLTKPTPQPTIEEQTLTAIKELKPKETDNGTGQK